MRRRTLLTRGAGAAAMLASPLILRPAEADPREVDVLLVLAVDVSRSMDEEEAMLQRAGYVAALRHQAVRDAILGGEVGAIGLCYLEWSGLDHQVLLVPWSRLGSAPEVEGFARRLEDAPVGIGTWTSIGAALDRARSLLQVAPYAGPRWVVDVSGDGTSNSGGSVEAARDKAVGAGIVVNGLPVMRAGGQAAYGPTAGSLPLDAYYRESVVGGFGAFVLPVEDFRSFAPAVRRKLVLEIAGRAEAPAVLA